ncbi:MAG: class I SAM-dependent DNA methyltransferase, partial [Bacteroidota bacterium]
MTRDQLKALEDSLWTAADGLRANSDLKASEYSTPVMGLIFLRFADNIYERHEAAIRAEYEQSKGGRREKPLHEIALGKSGFYLPDEARYDTLLNLPEEANVVEAIKQAMEAIEQYKPELQDVLPKREYDRFNRSPMNQGIPESLLRIFADIPVTAGGDLFGQIYEYFLGKFALSEGQGGGEFFTPKSVVRLMVEIVQPERGTVYDPACGSGGMFVQSAHFIEEHQAARTEGGVTDVYVYGQEKTLETVKLAKMNLAVNGLRGTIRQANSYYEDPHGSLGTFDYVFANPPFNVDEVVLDAVEKDPRFNAYGVPRRKTKRTPKKGKDGQVQQETVPNANYLWINLFATSLKPTGRAALVMANSASDARHSEADIRKALIEAGLIDAMLTLPSNMFYTVTLPATLWFFDKAEGDDRILFIDARNIFTQIDRAHREFSDAQVQNIAVISRLRRGQRAAFVELIDAYFADGMAVLAENEQRVAPLAAQLRDVLDDERGRTAAANLLTPYQALPALAEQYAAYTAKPSTDVDAQNAAQRTLRAAYTPFFEALHKALKQLDRTVRQHEKRRAEAARAKGKRGSTDAETKALKGTLEALHAQVKAAEVSFTHIQWLQDRFPEAR